MLKLMPIAQFKSTWTLDGGPTYGVILSLFAVAFIKLD